MSNITKEAQKELAEMENMLKKINEFQSHAPQGCLKIQHKGKNPYFYHQYMNEGTKKWDRKYIQKANWSLARELAQKHYYAAVKPILEKNVKELKRFIKQYHPEAIENIYEDLGDERKKLTDLLRDNKEVRIRKWNEEVFEPNVSYPENLRYETEQGDMVRSKSEVIIANILYQCREDILYKYEHPLKVIAGGKPIIIYPDFTILNVHTGKVTYWEHFGRMDDPNYADDFVRKANTYVNNNMFSGKDVIFTYESMEHPLEVSVIKKLVNDMRS